MRTEPQLRTGLRLAGLIGTFGAAALFGGALAWAHFTQISGAVIATGQVEVEGRPKTVQHLDGGIVEAIAVDDGQMVEAGQVLMRLDDTLLRANLLIYRTRLSEALAIRDRLIAEQSDAPQITFSQPDPMVSEADWQIHVTGQREVFEARQELEAGRQEQLAEKTRQFHNQIGGVNGLIDAKEEQRRLLAQELSSMSELSQKGLARAPQLLSLQRQQADLIGQISEHRSELARIRNSIRDTELQLLQGKRELKEQAVTELREITTQIQELRQQITSTEKQLERVAIRAPTAGRIHEMKITTIGGVVPPGGMILQVIPRDEGLWFRMRVDTASVDQVFPGQDAKLRFAAFNARTTPELQGRIVDISPTSVLDEATGKSFYWVKVTASDEELARLGTRALVPGMPVEAYLQTDDRTVLSYLTKPFADQLNQAFREE